MYFNITQSGGKDQVLFRKSWLKSGATWGLHHGLEFIHGGEISGSSLLLSNWLARAI